MSKISSAIAVDTTSWVEVPEVEGFEVHLRFITREDLMKIRKGSLTYKFSKKTRQREEEVDNDKFLERYSEKAIIDWRGLTMGHLPSLLAADITGANKEEVIAYSQEEAYDLLKNSSLFDQFVTDMMNDFEQFSVDKAESEAKN